MRKFLTGLALLAPAIATAQTPPYRQQSGYDTGYIINCTGLDGVSAARCLVPDRIMVDTNGVPLGTAANPIYVSGGGGGGTSNATSNQNYTATQAGTGYAVGDVIVRVVNSAPGTGAVAGAYWINETQGTLLSTAPTLSNLTQLPNTIVVSSLPAITGTVGVNNFPASFGVSSLPALPAGSNAIGTVGVTSLPALPAGTNIIGKTGIDQTTPGSTNNVTVGGLRYQLFGTYGGAGQTANATGTAVGPVLPNSYIFACSGTIGGGTITFQVLGPDGANFQAVSGINFTSLPASVGVVMPNITGATGSGSVTAANARAVLTGATSPSVFCSLS